MNRYIKNSEFLTLNGTIKWRGAQAAWELSLISNNTFPDVTSCDGSRPHLSLPVNICPTHTVKCWLNYHINFLTRVWLEHGHSRSALVILDICCSHWLLIKPGMMTESQMPGRHLRDKRLFEKWGLDFSYELNWDRQPVMVHTLFVMFITHPLPPPSRKRRQFVSLNNSLLWDFTFVLKPGSKLGGMTEIISSCKKENLRAV